MKKLLRFLRLPLFFVSSMMLVFGIAAMIAVMSLDYGKVYRSDELEDFGIYVNCYFIDDDTVAVEEKIWGTTVKKDYQYEIRDKELYIIYEDSEIAGYQYAGRVNPYELLLKYGYGDGTVVQLEFECPANEVITVVAAVMAGLGAVLLTTSIVIIILTKKGKFKNIEGEPKPKTKEQVEA